jgi:hypothetical protein
MEITNLGGTARGEGDQGDLSTQVASLIQWQGDMRAQVEGMQSNISHLNSSVVDLSHGMSEVRGEFSGFRDKFSEVVSLRFVYVCGSHYCLYIYPILVDLWDTNHWLSILNHWLVSPRAKFVLSNRNLTSG